ncbi:MAG: SUMF1/EgtB/PvdO family nonheme iron enzyme, partial [Anaerolineales bacterium]|nr:SUMF1/EgtB/PvdO family nonheme iron enzyme [Anaerolineales bacterium]
ILTWQQDRFVFNHPGFHAYFAARHLFELYGKSHPSQFGEAKATQLAAVFLPDKLLQQKWLEVFLLVAAYLDLTDNAVKPVDNQAQFLNVMLQHADRMSTQQPNTATAILTACTLARSEVIGRNSQLKSALQRRLETFFNNREQMRRNTPPRITEAGYSWSVLGDNRRSVHFLHAHSAEFCFIPAGEYQSATERLIIPYAYWLGRYPITQKQFNEFIRDRGYQTERFWPEVTERNQWQDGPILNRSQQPHQQPKRYQEPFNLDHYPVVGLTWFESLAYSRWLTEKAHQYRWLPENWQISLASEQEWVKAARGGLNIPKEPLIEPLNKLSHISPTVEVMLNPEPTRVYPWGNQTQPHLANHNATNLRETNTVGCFIDGRSPYGCEELCGNVWEWLRDQARGVRFTKGGSFIEPDHMMQIDYRKRWHGLEAHKYIGLRLALFPSDI